jgi:hypothetical protein
MFRFLLKYKLVLFLDRDTEETPSFKDIASECIQRIDVQLDKIDELVNNADTMKNNMLKLIRTILADPTATTDRFAEALEDAVHIQVVINNQEIESESEDEENTN